MHFAQQARLRRLAFRFAPVLWLCAIPARVQPQEAPTAVGRLEGDAIAVRGALSVEVENGRSVTLLGSGSEVTVRAGQARLALAEGGEIGICGPANFSLLKSGRAVTLALNYGQVHARLDGTTPLTVYTPLIVAVPIAIAGGAREATVGLERSGAMCVVAARGAVRIEQQLTGQILLVPQSGEVALTGGQLESLHGAAGSCQCEIPAARSAPLEGPIPPEVSVPIAGTPGNLTQPPQMPQPSAALKPKEELKPPAIDEPIYKVYMPALTFDARSPAPPPGPSPEMIVLVRRVRVRPVAVFHGRVTSPPAPPRVTPPVVHAANADETAPPRQTSTQDNSMMRRVTTFFRRLWSKSK